MPPSDNEEAEKLAKAYLADREIQQSASYLERGRQYAALSLVDLQTQWLSAGEAFLGRDDQSRVREFQDLDAEYRARKIDAPADLLKPAVNAAVERFKRYTADDIEHVEARLEKFVEDLGKPKN